MNMLDAIIETEFRYCSAMGARLHRSPHSVRVSDERIPEREAYNYVFILKDAPVEEVKALVQEELHLLERKGLPHIRIVFHPGNPHRKAIDALESFAYSSRFVMVRSLPELPVPVQDEHCRTLDAGDLGALHAFECHMYDARGARYARLQTEIKLDIYTDRNEFDLLLYSFGGRVVGDVELYTDNGMVKFDDFKVHPDFRRRGFGKSLQRFAISRACRNGASRIYAITDNDGFVKEMYRNDGFAEVGVLHTFRKQAAAPFLHGTSR
jgi:GNAT superfamily N-acetyltransferase